ncbi:hypothetical protein BS78_05G130300 [Paspalum vaginatum]|nr:hypothetical protein BS78_05G130300 [Paspalum vaginatum]
MEQSAIQEEMIRHRAEVQEPAFAILRERQASRPGAMRKEPVTFAYHDADYYRQVLDGIDPRLPHLDADAIINHLTLGISWRPNDHYLWNLPLAGYIASHHDYLLVLYFGAYRPGLVEPGCYLVINAWANSVAIVPPLSRCCFSSTSPCGIIGTGVAVLRHNEFGDYVLAELCLHRDSRSHLLPTNKATLFLWWSPSSGPPAGRWMQEEVVLPLPTDIDHTVTFRADMAFAVSSTTLCWADLRTGVLVCSGIDRLAAGAGTAHDCLVFRFIPLPEECARKPDLL